MCSLILASWPEASAFKGSIFNRKSINKLQLVVTFDKVCVHT